MFDAAGPVRCVEGVWTTIVSSDDSVASRAYRNLISQYWAHPESGIRLAVVSDASTAFLATSIERSIRAADRLWSVSASTYQPYPVVIVHDSASARDLAQQLGLAGFPAIEQTIADQEAEYGKCAAASFNSGQAQPWFLFCFGVDEAASAGQDLTLSNVGAHEFTHLVQYALMGDILSQRTLARPLAPWFAEGMASYAAAVLASVSGAASNIRAMRVEFLKSTRTSLSDYNSSFTGGDVYLLGMFASEAFYALQGNRAMEKVLQACRAGLTFDAALKQATGRSLNVWTPVLSKYINSVKARTPLTLTELQDAKQRAFTNSK